jgi:phage shock protein PspC (stress-responsive transcriptional regulator)
MRYDLDRERDMIRDNYSPQVPGRGLLLGTCAGISETSGVPAIAVRAAAIVALCFWFKLVLLAYCGGAIFYRFRR